MIVQEFWVVFLLGSQKGNHFITSIKHIVAMSPFTMNDNALVIGDKFIVVSTLSVDLPSLAHLKKENFLWPILGGVVSAIYTMEHLF